MLDKILVHAFIGGKYLDCGSPKLSVNLVLTRDHWLPPCLIPNTSEGRRIGQTHTDATLKSLKLRITRGRISLFFSVVAQ
jgi:hypothetical protein